MSLTERERRYLGDLAQEFRREDPLLAHMLTRGRWLPRRTRMWVSAVAFLRTRWWWQYLLALSAIGGAVTMIVAGVHARMVGFVVGASLLVGTAVATCAVTMVRRRLGLRADDWRICRFDTMDG